MDSTSKTVVTEEQARAIARSAFGADTGLTEFSECSEGWFNAVYRLGFADGRSCILKVAPPPEIRVLRYEHDIISTEVDALRTLVDRTSVPVPRVLHWDTSTDLLPSPFFLMEECQGVLLSELRPTLAADLAARIDADTVRIVAEMHTITAPTFGRPAPGAPRHHRWADAFLRLVCDLLADAEDAAVQLPVDRATITDLVESSRAQLDEVTTASFVDWDLWDANIFIDPATHEIVGVIDLERVLWADPLMEAQFIGHRDDALTAAYGRPLFGTPGAARRRQLYDMYLYLVMTIESSYRSYPEDDIEVFARAMLDTVFEELLSTGA